jgi:ubiquinone biosynthesis protein COQ9
MGDQDVRERLLEAVLTAGQPSWSESFLERASREAGLSRLEVQNAVPNGSIDLVDFWFAGADRAMQEALANCPNDTKVRARATLAVRVSLEHLENKPALRHALRVMGTPKKLKQSFKPPQENLWVIQGGSGRSPSV